MTGKIQDLALIERCLSSIDQGAWEVFVRTYSRLIWSAVHKTFRASSFGYSREDIEDVFHSIFLSLIDNDFRKLRQFKSRNACRLSTWLTVVAVNTAIDYMRKETRARPALLMDSNIGDAMFADQRQNVETLLMKQQSESAVSRAIDALPERDKKVYDLLFNKSMDPDAAAAYLGISISSLYTIKHRFINKLKKILIEV